MSKDTPGAVPRTPDLSVVIPCFNESARLDRLVQGVRDLAAAAGDLRLEVVLVDDGSRDDTAARLHEVAAGLQQLPALGAVHVVALPTNQGKGAALRAGVAVTNGRRVLTADADMATALTEVLVWQRNGHVRLGAEPAPVVLLASREHEASQVEDSGPRRAMGRVFNLLVQLFTGLRLTDTQCGFKLYPGAAGRRLFGRLRTRGWSHDVELLLMAQRAGLELIALPVRWQAIADSRVRPLRDAVRMASALAVIRTRVWLREDLGLGVPDAWRSRGWQRAAALMFLALAGVVLVTFRDYGITWDEELHRVHGRLVIDYWASLLSGELDRHVMGLSNVFLYGGLFDLVGYLGSTVLPFSEFESRHLVNALFGLLGVVAAYRLADLLWGARAGFFAAAALVLIPTYYGHMFANPKDVPFAAVFAWGLYYVVRVLREMPAVSRGTTVKCALAIGAAAGIRAGGLLLLGYLAIAGAVVLIVRVRPFVGLWKRDWSAAVTSLAAVAVGAWVAMMVSWPYAFERPIDGPLIALRTFSSFSFSGAILFGGDILQMPQVPTPFDYVPRLLAIQLPLLTQALLVASAGWVVLAMQTRSRRRAPGSAAGAAFLWLAFLFPAVHVVVTRAVLYDNLRQLTFLLPIAAVLAAHGAEVLWSQSPTRFARALLAIVLAAGALWTVRAYVSLHPYQYVYYNEFVGGVAGASADYETDYWAASYREAALRLNEYAAEGGHTSERPLRVYVTGPSLCAREYFGDSIRWVGGPALAEMVLAVTRTRSHRDYEGPEVLRVEREGVALAVVIDVRR